MGVILVPGPFLFVIFGFGSVRGVTVASGVWVSAGGPIPAFNGWKFT